MSRKNYIAIARAIRDLRGDTLKREDVIKALSDVFAADNYRFQRQRFADACTPEASEVKAA